jgi:hypothetical protein
MDIQREIKWLKNAFFEEKNLEYGKITTNCNISNDEKFWISLEHIPTVISKFEVYGLLPTVIRKGLFTNVHFTM